MSEGRRNFLRALQSEDVPDFKVCSSIRDLNLDLCSKLGNDSMMQLAKYCPDLRKISLNGCFKVTDLGIQCLLKHCKYVQHLEVSNLSTLQKSRLTDTSLEAVVEYGHNLRALFIERVSSITPEGVQLIGVMNELKKILTIISTALTIEHKIKHRRTPSKLEVGTADEVSSYVSKIISTIKNPLRKLQNNGSLSSSSNTAISTAIWTLEQSKPNLIKIFEVVITLAEQLKRDSLIPDRILQEIEGVKNTQITSNFEILRSVRDICSSTKNAIETAEQQLTRKDVNESTQVLRNLAQIIQQDPAFPEAWRILLGLPIVSSTPPECESYKDVWNHANLTKMCGTITLLLSFVSMIVVYVA
ncbi:hypothetical protein FSP39_020816 [Pinctada imbricata]|uniref:Uncharacterized protein n=1 Tax=Pinctada imbricata TaxID=66713 RepID=A0AA88YN55_PINIB|nr:hypothetical protein FSP39_020816 [Pinctada imbricata]